MAERTTRPPRRLWLGTHRIDIRSPVPKYSQLRTILLDVIAEAAVDDPAPSERELMARFGVARMTVRKAVDHLVAEGRLYRVPGKGTYVARPKIEMPLRLSSFTEDMRARGLYPGARELDRRVVRAGRTLARVAAGRDRRRDRGARAAAARRRRADGDRAVSCPGGGRSRPGCPPTSPTARSTPASSRSTASCSTPASSSSRRPSSTPSDARILAHPAGPVPCCCLRRRSSSRGVPVEYVVSTLPGGPLPAAGRSRRTHPPTRSH